MTNSSRSIGKRQQTKFPLSLHRPTGQYRKRIRGKDFYFGTDRDKALARWLAEKDDLLAGREPTNSGDGCSMRELCNTFLTDRKAKRDSGELAPRTFDDYHASCERLLDHLGKSTLVDKIRPDRLMEYRQKLSKTLNPTSLGNEVNRAKIILRFAFEGGLTDRPIRFGNFKRPSKAVMRRQRAEAL